MRIVGLTGGIACGKSTVAQMLRRGGVPVIDADQLARRITESGQPALAKIVETFGADVLNEDGTLDRRALGDKIFGDTSARKQLEAITHPAIALESQKEFVRLAAEGHELAFYEAALLVEAGTWKMFAALVVVSASVETQKTRLMARDPDLTEAQADARIAAQMPLAEKEALAHLVVNNDGDVDHLQIAVDRVLAAFQTRKGLQADG